MFFLFNLFHYCAKSTIFALLKITKKYFILYKEEMLPTQNQKLLDELNAGSKAALETLFRTYYPRLLAFARSYVYDADAAQDIVQEMFIYLWSRRGTISQCNIAALLMTGVRNRCINYINHQSTLRKHLERQEVNATQRLTNIDMCSDTASVVETRDILNQLDSFLNTIPPRQKEAFTLVRMDGMKLREAADKMEVSVAMGDKLAKKALDDVTQHFGSLYPTDFVTTLLIAALAWEVPLNMIN